MLLGCCPQSTHAMILQKQPAQVAFSKSRRTGLGFQVGSREEKIIRTRHGAHSCDVRGIAAHWCTCAQ
jgi:hypothetical protein